MKKLLLVLIVFNLFVAEYVFADSLTCHSNMENVVAVFQPISYTCENGYFLPANTLGCHTCPNGYICNGGTFNFNPNQNQGLTRTSGVFNQNISKACSVNFPKTMAAIFAPNEETSIINLTWNDGENTVSNVCVYGDTISLPGVPTRTGYNFTGWVVRQNND